MSRPQPCCYRVVPPVSPSAPRAGTSPPESSSRGWLCGREGPEWTSPGKQGAESILEDQKGAAGLVAFAGAPKLVSSLDIQSEEWATPRGLTPMAPLTKQGYLRVLLAMWANLELP